MEPSKEVSAATQPVVNRAPRIMPGEKPALALQMDSAKFQRNHELHVYVLAPTTCPSMKEGPISQWDSTTTNPPHWSGDMYQEQLNRPTTHWCQPLPYLSFTASCVSRPGANGAKNYHSPSLQSHTTYLWNLQPITNNPIEINTAKPDPHTTSKGAPAATQPEDQCGPHLMPVEKAALTLQMESVTPCNNFRGYVHVRTCTNGITHAPLQTLPMEPVELLALTASGLIT